MNQPAFIYVAISNKTNSVIPGAKGQYAFGHPTDLKKSLGYVLSHTAREQQVRPMDLYSILEIDVSSHFPK